jgi:phenylalanyl-tRNA synthetase beta chain
MKFTLAWLKEHLETQATLDEIVDALTDLGLEVESVSNPLEKLKGFTVGLVTEAHRHPDADRLRVCTVETDAGPRQIVCGAPNARAGIRVVVARPGMYVPGIDTTIQTGTIRGVESQGMMCSEREMQLSDEHDGIIELPGEPPVGMEFADWLAEHRPAKADPVIEIKITPNRPDALGVRGIARDLAARGLGRLTPEASVTVAGGFPCPVGVTIAPDLLARGCPLFAGRLIRGVTNGPSPAWLQERLKAIGLRPISALVDVTNFFTYDRNRPLHVFDAGKLRGDLTVRMARPGESLRALDGRDYALRPGIMVIADDAGVASIGGIIGGEASGCTETTTEVFVESAFWDTLTIAAAGRALKVTSDARYRNERGIDPEWDIPGLHAVTAMILELCGGEPSEIVVAGAVPDTDRAYRLDTGRVSSLVGLEIPPERQRQTLTALGFRLTGDMAHPPSWRPDVQGEADLVEEIARIASLSGLKGAPMPRPQAGVPKPVLTDLQRREQAGRRAAAALGYNECVTYSFIDRAAAELFGGGGEAVRLENPISAEMSHLRPDLLPGLLQAAARNQARGFADLALYEVGPAFHGGEPGDERLMIAGLLTGRRAPRDPWGSARPVDVFDVRADAEAVLAAMGAPAKMQILRTGPGWWHPGRHGVLCLGPKKVLGVFGELHPRVLAALAVKGPAMAFALWPAEIPAPRNRSATRPALALAALQAVERDFAFVVDARIEALALVNAAAGADKALIESVRVFDEFAGDRAAAQLGPGRKSLALTVRLQPTDHTLTDKEIEAVAARIVDKVARATGATLRG